MRHNNNNEGQDAQRKVRKEINQNLLQCVTAMGPIVRNLTTLIIVIVITFYSPSCLGQETAKGPFGLRVKLPPAHLSTTHGGGFTLSLFNVERQAGKLWIPIFIVFGLTRLGIEPESTVSVADALSTRPLIGLINFKWINFNEWTPLGIENVGKVLFTNNDCTQRAQFVGCKLQ